MPTELPPTMLALELHSYERGRDSLVLAERPVPRPGLGQVLVRIAAAPVNPADLSFLRGHYGVRRQLPTVPGWEGSGTIVACGGGLVPRALLGRRIACAAADNGDGTWAEYMLTSPLRCLPLLPGVSDEAGATLIVNPCSAWGLMELARRGGHRAVVQTAAAGSLGRMILRLSRRFNIPIVNVVHRPEQVELLHGLGAEHVLNSSEPDFDDRLRERCAALKVSLALDAVAGEMSGRLLQALPRGGRLVVYGSLSLEGCLLHPGDLIFKRKQVMGFWLNDWLPRKNLPGILYTAWQVQRLLDAELKTEVQARLPLAEAVAGIGQYTRAMTEGKVLLIPGR